MQHKSDHFVEGNGIGPPTGYSDIDLHNIQNQGMKDVVTSMFM